MPKFIEARLETDQRVAEYPAWMKGQWSCVRCARNKFLCAAVTLMNLGFQTPPYASKIIGVA
jgi:hypothetical protein